MPQLEDSFLHKGHRRAMCARLAERGITDPAVLAAMEKVPRHWFVDPTVEEHAYDDQALPIGCAQTISQPSTVAFQTQLLELKRGMKVLEIGTGSGYQTAVLCTLGARVFTIERQKALFDSTKQLLYDLHYHARCFLGDGYKGLTEVDYAPFDRVIITCGAPYVPTAVMEQLVPGGIMVIPVGNNNQEMLRIVKPGNDSEEPLVETYGNCRFVPMLSDINFRQEP